MTLCSSFHFGDIVLHQLVVSWTNDEEHALIHWLYDFAFMTFVGTMGVFLVGSLLWMTAILLDRNGVFPRWFGYFNLANALTEVVVAPAWIFNDGWIFGWNGVVTYWLQVVVFATYTGVFITLLRRLILREDFGTGPLPELASDQAPSAAGVPEPAQ